MYRPHNEDVDDCQAPKAHNAESKTRVAEIGKDENLSCRYCTKYDIEVMIASIINSSPVKTIQ